MTVPLPAPRDPATYRVAVVCLGNICRSPIADVVIEDRLAAAGLAGTVTVESFGTGPWHVDEPMDERSARVLREAGYDATRHRGRQVMELFARVAHEQQAGVIVVTHDHRSLDVFDTHYKMEDGLLQRAESVTQH